jgi:hypothetical protein
MTRGVQMLWWRESSSRKGATRYRLTPGRIGIDYNVNPLVPDALVAIDVWLLPVLGSVHLPPSPLRRTPLAAVVSEAVVKAVCGVHLPYNRSMIQQLVVRRRDVR